MTRDIYLRILFIPVLGVFLPFISGIITYELYAWPVLMGANLYFIGTSFIIWIGCKWIHSHVRPLFPPLSRLFTQLVTVCFACTLYGASIGCISTLGWMKWSNETFSWNDVIRFVLICVVAVVVFTLVYEILFLNKEREEDTKMVDQLDKERSQAELIALRNEMDPHFIFNSLNTLNHLIMNNPMQAHLYNNKLAQVYKYFLITKNRELISLKNELEFIDDYFYLLKLRHTDKLQLETRLNSESDESILIPPCSLQVLIENAIKHNEFTQDDPLQIIIAMNGQHLKVINKIKPKPYIMSSTHIGLKNLSSRYKLICNKDIIVEPGKEVFSVKLPIIR